MSRSSTRSRSRGLGRRSTAVGVATLLLVGAVSAPASAAAFDSTRGASVVGAGATVAVGGTLVVFSGTGVGADNMIVPLPDQVVLRTDTGLAVTISGPHTEGVVSGSEFTGTLSVPAEIAPTLNDLVEAALAEAEESPTPLRAAADLDAAILVASAELAAALTVESASITPPAVESTSIDPEFAATRPSTQHAIDVAVMALPQATTPARNYPLSNADVDTLVKTISTFWTSQSAGQVSRIVMPTAVKRLVSASACNANTAMSLAAQAFGDPAGNTYFTASGARHLLVLVPSACGAGTGLGSVGTLTSGGAAWAPYDDVIGTTATAHEFGHNLGLHHSNAHLCPNQIVEGVPQANGTFTQGCADSEYEDPYDVMGAGYIVNGGTNAQLTALNVTHKRVIGALSGPDLPTVQRTSTLGSLSRTFALNPISAGSGTRGLRVIDPTTNSEYLIEYRSGTGSTPGRSIPDISGTTSHRACASCACAPTNPRRC